MTADCNTEDSFTIFFPTMNLGQEMNMNASSDSVCLIWFNMADLELFVFYVCNCHGVYVFLFISVPQYGDTPLHIAVRYGHVKACDTLFATKINTSEQNNVRQVCLLGLV